MLMGIIIKDLSNKLKTHIEEKGGVIHVDAAWTNKWLEENGGSFTVEIVDANGNNIGDAKVAIKKKD